jgi:dihydropteroate synthase type 2
VSEVSWPLIVGIVNVTEDSFSDGGRYLDPDDALAHARRLVAQGADIVELGAASSHPDAAAVSPAEESRRLVPVLEGLRADRAVVSVDSMHPETWRLALAHGAAYLNDIQGFPEPAKREALAASDCKLVVMHSIQRSGIATRVHTDPTTIWARIEQFFEGRLAALHAAGIGRERLIVDPGLGFFLGANPEPSLAVLGDIQRLRRRFGVPILVSPSRKSFLRETTGRGLPHSGPATLAAELHAAGQGADYIRTHDVQALHDALIVQAALGRHRSPRTGRDTQGHGAN